MSRSRVLCFSQRPLLGMSYLDIPHRWRRERATVRFDGAAVRHAPTIGRRIRVASVARSLGDADGPIARTLCVFCVVGHVRRQDRLGSIVPTSRAASTHSELLRPRSARRRSPRYSEPPSASPGVLGVSWQSLVASLVLGPCGVPASSLFERLHTSFGCRMHAAGRMGSRWLATGHLRISCDVRRLFATPPAPLLHSSRRSPPESGHGRKSPLRLGQRSSTPHVHGHRSHAPCEVQVDFVLPGARLEGGRMSPCSRVGLIASSSMRDC